MDIDLEWENFLNENNSIKTNINIDDRNINSDNDYNYYTINEKNITDSNTINKYSNEILKSSIYIYQPKLK